VKLRLLLMLLALGAALPAFAEEDDPLGRITLEEAEEIDGLFDVWDPAERMNRRLYWFNSKADDYALLPAMRAYEWTFPQLVRSGVANFFSNLGEIPTFINSVFQLHAHKSASTLLRFGVNSTLGIAGLWDPAVKIGLPRYEEDFGQTLGYWGSPAGPYFVIPMMGPSSLRDAFGFAVDRVPFFLIGFPPIWLYPLEAVDTRANNPFRYGDMGGAFEYEVVRFLALERRKLLIAE
jgi:phospholipid-binding lipoprotein MlaA